MSHIMFVSGIDDWGTGGTVEYNGLTPDYYISTTGSDSNDGLTPATAWAITAVGYLNSSGTPVAGKQSTYAGKIVGFLDGTYSLYDDVGLVPTNSPSSSGRNHLRIAGGTDNDNRTIFVSQTPRGAVIDSQRAKVQSENPSRNWFVGQMGAIGDFVTIDGFHYTGGHYRCIINYLDASNYTIKNCRFSDQSFTYWSSSGGNSAIIYSQGETDIVISNCRFEGGSAPTDSERHAHIETYDASNRVTIEYCTFIRDSSGGGNIIQPKQGNNKNFTIANNYFEQHRSGNCIRWDGDPLDATATFTVQNNVFNIQTTTTAAAFFVNTNGNAGAIDINHNTWFGDPGAAYCWRTYEGDPTTVHFNHNITSRSVAPDTCDIDLPTIAELGTVDYNLYDSSPSLVVRYNDTANSETGLTAWAAACSKEANSAETTDPKFVASGSEADYFALQATSPGYQAGSSGEDIGAPCRIGQVGADF